MFLDPLPSGQRAAILISALFTFAAASGTPRSKELSGDPRVAAAPAAATAETRVFEPASAPRDTATADTLSTVARRHNHDMVLIAGGTFAMGADVEEDHQPVHDVTVSSFYLDAREVTNREYQEFCTETGHPLPQFWGLDALRLGAAWPDHPVVCVTWRDAADYAAWRGCRLPTEAEWEYAARGGLPAKKWPWGDAITPEQANYWKSEGTRPTGSYPPNGYGLYDMAGNVGEWVADWYDQQYYSLSPAVDPTGPGEGKYRCVRGGGWHSGAYCNRVYRRLGLLQYWVDFNTGFRCARNAD